MEKNMKNNIYLNISYIPYSSFDLHFSDNV